MHYDAFIHPEGNQVLAEFPDCPGCQTFASGDEIHADAQEALEGWLEAHLVGGKVPPRPLERAVAPDGMKLLRVPIRASLAAALTIRWERLDAGLSQAQLAERVGCHENHIRWLELPNQLPTLNEVERVAHALGMELDIRFRRKNPR